MADGTQHLIDIVAKLTGGSTAVAQLGQMDADMLAAGKSAEELERATKMLSGSLEDSAVSLKSASDALSAGEKKYSQLEIAADRAAKAVEKLAASGKSGDAFEKRQAEAVAGAKAASLALAGQASTVDKLRAAEAGAKKDQDDLAKGLKNVSEAAKKAAATEAAAKGSGKVNEISEALGRLGGPLGQAGQKVFGVAEGFKKLGASVGALGPYVAIAVVIAAIAAAAFVAAVAITKMGISFADAQRTQALLSDGIAGSVAGGRALDVTLDKLGATVPQTRQELQGMASDLAKQGLKGKELSTALEEAAIKAAKLKFGPDFAKQMLALPVQAERLQANLAKTFGGLKIDALLEGVQTLVKLFDASTESGQALKFLFEALFQPLVDGATGAIPTIERMFLTAEIWALKAYLALKPWSAELKFIGEAFLVLAAIVVGVLGVAVGAVFGAIALSIAGVLAPIFAVVTALTFLWGAIKGPAIEAVSFLSNIGTQMIQGLVNGITGGATAVIQAMTNVVGGAIDSAKHLLGIASPSKVFEGIGDFTAQGFAAGIEGGADDAHSAISSMVEPPSASLGAGGGGSRFGDVNISITIEGSGSPEATGKSVRDQLLDLFLGGALTAGGGEVPA